VATLGPSAHADDTTSRVVIRGAGSIGRRHVEVFARTGATVSLWPVRTNTRGAEASASVELLDDETGPAALAAADLAVIATTTSRHVTDATEALSAGSRQVLVEKPVAVDVLEAAPLRDHERAGDVWVAAPLRAYEGFRHLAKLVPDIGTPVSAHVWCQSWLPDWRPAQDYRQSYSARRSEGGALRDLVHELDYVQQLLGDPSLMGARLEYSGPLDIEAEQAATLLWSTPTATITCRLDYVTRPSARGIVLRGPNGSLEWDVNLGRVTHSRHDGHAEERFFADDLDRDLTMLTQARAALELSPGSDEASRRAAGAPATLAEGCSVLELCDQARGIRR
jgi:predicted dehydrogenase